MSLTLALDELITDPKYANVLAAINQTIPVSDLDQFAAAGHHADTLRNTLMDALGGDPNRCGLAPAADVPDWLRLGAIDALAVFVTGRSDTCRHSPDPNFPQPVLAAAWKPGLITCIECVYLLRCAPNSLAERTCDGCGHECAGPSVGDGIWSAALQVGLLIYQYGTCGTCLDTIPKPITA